MEDDRALQVHLPCEDCGSSDALSVYTDHTYCFSCGAHHFTDGGERPMEKKADFNPISGKAYELKARRISKETCEKWGYKVGELFDEKVQIASYYKDGKMVGQKIRTKNKDFKWFGSGDPGLYGMHLWKQGGKMVTVTEGEIDALSVSQVQDNKWPVVSLPHGAQNGPKAIKENLEYLESFEKVVFMFDMDEPGRKAASECAKLLSPGKGHIAELPMKDPNECLVAGKGGEITKAMWNAKPWIPSGIVNGSDLWEDVQKPIETGLSYPWTSLTNYMHGIRCGEVYVLGAGTGLGKTTVFKEIAYHLSQEHKEKVGLLFLEEQNNMTALSMMSLSANQMLHIPGKDINDETRRDHFDAVFGAGRVYMFNHFGSTSFNEIASRIRYLVVSCGVRYIFLDHLAALTTGDVKLDERREIDFIMTELASMVRELKFTLFLISHLSTASGDKSHEEGGRVTIKNFRGSRAIGQWADALFALERNQQDDDEESRHTSTFRILKDRYTGQAVGKTFKLKFNVNTGRLEEVEDKNDVFKEEVAEGDPDDFTDF